MNYIHKLQKQNDSLAQQVKFLEDNLQAFKAFLQTSGKFNGLESDGSRRDWISTGDVIEWIREIHNAQLNIYGSMHE